MNKPRQSRGRTESGLVDHEQERFLALSAQAVKPKPYPLTKRERLEWDNTSEREVSEDDWREDR